MHSHESILLKRAQRFRDDRVAPVMTRRVATLDVEAWRVEGEPVPVELVRAAHREGRFAAVTLPYAWGRPWDTWWFRISGNLPEEDSAGNLRLSVDLGFKDDWPGNQCEALAYDTTFTPLKAINSRNREIVLPAGTRQVEIFVEAAANPDVLSDGFRPIVNGSLETRDKAPAYTLRSAEVVERNDAVWALFHDVDVLIDLAEHLEEDSVRRSEIIHALSRAIDIADARDIPASAPAAREALAPVLGAVAVPSALTVHAIGHAHIDSAWLWPVRETIRKVARTFSNVVDLADTYEDFTFTATSAQQYEWLRETQPDIFERVRRVIERGQWFPSGGMWVESDATMPGGEALFRQFDFGIRFFEDAFGVRSRTLWLPDSFGYSGALPQIARQCGFTGFLTQKMSWNQHNHLPHSTLWWEGIDGTRLFTHFPPVNCYDSEVSAEEYTLAVRNYREKGLATHQVIPFGYGDGGGGPTARMVERVRRLGNLEGAPRMSFSNPDSFFEAAVGEYPGAPTYVGEMYLEFHRGIYTSQRGMKEGNRRAEHAMRVLECAWAAAVASAESARARSEVAQAYDQDAVDALWKTLLLNQFHDILPGSSIAWVHSVARKEYGALLEAARSLTDAGLARVASTCSGDAVQSVVNASHLARREVIEARGAEMLVEVPGLSATPLGKAAVGPRHPVIARNEGATWVLENGLVCVEIDERGDVSLLRDLTAGRDLTIPGEPFAAFRAFEDTPNEFDAWDIERHYMGAGNEYALPAASSIELVSSSELRARLRVSTSWEGSTLVREYTLDADSPRLDIACHVDFHHRETLLKLSLPLAVRARESIAECAFGSVRRPIHENTSWDFSRYEYPMHRWVMVEDSSYGVAVANDCTYGHDVQAVYAPGVGGPRLGSRVSLSLVRAPLYPDPETDQGEHSWRFSVLADASLASAAAEGYRLNLPLALAECAAFTVASLESPAVHIESIRPARDGSGDLIVRLYEGTGAHVNTRLSLGAPASRIVEVDPLERPLGGGQWEPRVSLSGERVDDCELSLSPHAIMTLRMTPAQ